MLHWACWNFDADVAEFLLDNTRIDPLAKNKDENHALLVVLRDLGEGRAPDQGLPFLELFHRKAPQALDMPGEKGKELRSTLTFCDRTRTKTTPCDLFRFAADPHGCHVWPCPVPPAAAGAGGRPGPEANPRRDTTSHGCPKGSCQVRQGPAGCRGGYQGKSHGGKSS